MPEMLSPILVAAVVAAIMVVSLAFGWYVTWQWNIQRPPKK